MTSFIKAVKWNSKGNPYLTLNKVYPVVSQGYDNAFNEYVIILWADDDLPWQTYARNSYKHFEVIYHTVVKIKYV